MYDDEFLSDLTGLLSAGAVKKSDDDGEFQVSIEIEILISSFCYPVVVGLIIGTWIKCRLCVIPDNNQCLSQTLISIQLFWNYYLFIILLRSVIMNIIIAQK